ncbi:MAG TPA: KEOPS complex subunit Cgi121 [Nitrososphaerales archaeon]|nr:KEOPS complex subunit Cgi121 [Nitrososphaerales archaeon]
MRLVARCFLLPNTVNPEEAKMRTRAILPRVLVQVVVRRAVANERTVEMMAWQSRSAESSGCLLARTVEMDLLLRIAGTTQISRAIRECGAKSGGENVLIVAGDSRSLDPPKLARLGLKDRLPRSELSDGDSALVERAAMLNAVRG